MEVWKPIPGHPGYEASNLGNIRSLDRLVRSGICGHRLSPGRQRVLSFDRNGYAFVRLARGVNRSVHVLVAAAWIGRRPAGSDVNHRDGVKRNNRPENLEYVTRRENILHSWRMGLQGRKGSRKEANRVSAKPKDK